MRANYEHPQQTSSSMAKTQEISPKVRNKTGMSRPTTVVHYNLAVLATAVRQKKVIKGIQVGEEAVHCPSLLLARSLISAWVAVWGLLLLSFFLPEV